MLAWQINVQLHVWTVCRLHLHVDVEHVESDSPVLSVSFFSLSDIMDSGAVKAVRQGHQRHFSAPPGAVCQSWLWFKASHVINNRVNQLATGSGPGVNVSVNCEHSSPSYTRFTPRSLQPAAVSLAAAFNLERSHLRVMRIHINLQAQEINSEKENTHKNTETSELQRPSLGLVWWGHCYRYEPHINTHIHTIMASRVCLWQMGTAGGNISTINMM